MSISTLQLATGICGAGSAGLFFVSERKNNLIQPKKVIAFSLFFIVLIAIAGFSGFLNSWDPSLLFILNQVYFLFLGFFFTYYFYKYYSVNLQNLILSESIVVFATAALGITIFWFIFNYFHIMPFGGYFCLTIIPFFLPFLYRETFFLYLKIPRPIYKVWRFPPDFYDPDISHIDLSQIVYIEMELRKKITDTTETNLMVGAPLKMILSDCFFLTVQDYNQNQPDSPIQTKNASGETYEWQFFIKPTFFVDRKYLDPDSDILTNNIKKNFVILAERVIQN